MTHVVIALMLVFLVPIVAWWHWQKMPVCPHCGSRNSVELKALSGIFDEVRMCQQCEYRFVVK